MKNVVVLYNLEAEWGEETPLKNSPETRASFEDFYDFARTLGFNFFRADVAWFDKEHGYFEKAWTFDQGRWQHVEKPVVPDAVFDKVAGKYDYELFPLKMEMQKRFPVVNSPLFRTLFDNKLAQYLAFGEHMPRSFLAENEDQFKKNIKLLATEKVVIKELYGSGGKQVSIGEKAGLKIKNPAYPFLLQEFIETAGVPEVSSPGDVADLRLVYINNELIYALSRIAKSGSLFTNFHQGAQAVLVPVEKIPDSCLAVAQAINKKLFLSTNINYSLDFMFTKEGEPLFIEMNTTPGFDLLRLVGTPTIKENYYRKLLATFE